MKSLKSAGRPVEKFGTQPKTYCFFVEDITKANYNGWSPKEIFRLGILAKQDNPQLMLRLNEAESKNEKLAKVIEKFGRRLIELEGKVPE